MRLSRVIPAIVRKQLRRLKHFAWRYLDELVLERDLLSYKMPAMAARITVSIEESENPQVQIADIDPNFGDATERFLSCGFRVLVCYSGGDPVGYIWLHDMSVTERHPALDRFGLQLHEGDIYLFNFYVAPEFRKDGTAGAFFARVIDQLRRDGFARAYGFVAANNIPARWLYVAHGWQTIDRISGPIIGNAVLFSNRGVFYNSSLLSKFDRRRRRVVQEFLPLNDSARGAVPRP